LNPQTSNKAGPTRSSLDLNRVTSVVFVVTIVALAVLSVQLKVLTLDQGPSGSGHGNGGNGTGNGTGMGKGAGEATSAQGGGNGGAGVNDSAQKLGYGPGGGGGSGFVKPQVVKIKNETPSSTPVDKGSGGSGDAEGKSIDRSEKVYHAGGIRMGTNSSSGGGGGGHNGIQVPQVQLPEKLKWLLLIITIGAIVAAAGVLLSSYMKARREALRKASKPRGKGKRKKLIPDAVAAAVTDEFIQTIEMTYDALEKMGDVRKAITICYSRMCGVIAEKGLIRSPDITPREFYTAVKKSFDIDSNAMKGLTLLFEEAVYSEHALTEAHRSNALKLLKGAVEEVKGW
jgi:hypothetical protein